MRTTNTYRDRATTSEVCNFRSSRQCQTQLPPSCALPSPLWHAPLRSLRAYRLRMPACFVYARPCRLKLQSASLRRGTALKMKGEERKGNAQECNNVQIKITHRSATERCTAVLPRTGVNVVGATHTCTRESSASHTVWLRFVQPIAN